MSKIIFIALLILAKNSLAQQTTFKIQKETSSDSLNYKDVSKAIFTINDTIEHEAIIYKKELKQQYIIKPKNSSLRVLSYDISYKSNAGTLREFTINSNVIPTGIKSELSKLKDGSIVTIKNYIVYDFDVSSDYLLIKDANTITLTIKD
ncbi:MAG: hypothetical protein ACLGGV_02610 [Bacteroidia bacterium]